ncbi:lysine--tRNA ligase, putative [Plasmodium sp. gorilla clade G2]|uniref:lysine--tRNA ligase, putative n=1 Tax=Plasmodium sp. gorilla clade G2 TaxID=880535 RepID=UPI000D20247C|nr:lysine--tRNA ligase, putative [Plasmodium sp. gorilla clade G2]SOV18859.1 lysine--tRNA ligase, putative [Plasmodium sp. gorilla clade G2]
MKKKKKPYIILLFLLFQLNIFFSFSIFLCNSISFKNNKKNQNNFFFVPNKGIGTIYNKRKAKKHFSLYNHGKEFHERVKKLHILSDVLNIDAYPSTFIKRNIKIDDLKKKFEHLKDGERDDKIYVIYGRVTVKRNNGMFMNIQDDEGNIQIYLDENLPIKGKKNDNKKINNNKIEEAPNQYHMNNNTASSILSNNNKTNKNDYVINDQSYNEKYETHNNQIMARKIIELGDFVAVKGFVRKTLRGEITLHAKDIYILTKSLLPLPDKYKGMKDVEYKYRKRYLDFLTNNDQKDKIKRRYDIIQEIRKYLLKRNFLEVDTPILQLIPGGATAKPFETYLKSLNLLLYLRISPELFLKKLIVSGISEQIFELSKCFRNEGLSSIHNPEFTMLEIYKSYTNYKYMMNFVEKIIKHLFKKFPYISYINSSNSNTKEKNNNNINNKWKKISFIKIIKNYTSINFLKLSFDEAYNEANKLNIHFDQPKEQLNWGLIVEEVFKKKVEPYLPNEPIHIYHLPSDTSPLAKTLTKNTRLSERFETYIGQMEIANGYSEEANALIQEKKFLSQIALKNIIKTNEKNIDIPTTSSNDQHKCNHNETHQNIKELSNKDNTTNIYDENKKSDNNQIDYDYVTALAHGLPPTGGLGIGIDRLCMLFTNTNSIKNIVSFPIIKPHGKE